MPPKDNEEVKDKEIQEKPNSEDLSQEPSQVSKDDLNALIKRLDKQDNQIKAFQAGQDKQIGKNRDEIARILALSEKGKDATEIERELVIDRLLESGEQNTSADSSDSGRTEESSAFDVNAVATSLKLDPNDPLVAGAKVAFRDDPKGLFNKLESLAERQNNPSGTANHPQGSSDIGNGNQEEEKGPFSDFSSDELGEKLIELGKHDYAGNEDQRKAIRAELAERDKT